LFKNNRGCPEIGRKSTGVLATHREKLLTQRRQEAKAQSTEKKKGKVELPNPLSIHQSSPLSSSLRLRAFA
jgi:hypothetical protein